MQIQYRGGGAFWNVVGIICQSAICIPLLKVSNTPFELFVDNALLGGCSDHPPSLGFFGSSWVVWGQKMSTLKTLMSQVLPNTLVKVLFGSKTWGAQIFVWGGGLQPPCSAAYAVEIMRDLEPGFYIIVQIISVALSWS